MGDNGHKTRVLFLCTHNQARSQMAEGFLRELGKDRYEVFSAGTNPASSVHILAMRALAEEGIDISQQQPKKLEQFLDQEFDYIITTCDRLQEFCPTFPGQPTQLHWDIADPTEFKGTTEEQYQEFRKVANKLKGKLKVLLDLPEPPLETEKGPSNLNF
jgi:arsenate reductase